MKLIYNIFYDCVCCKESTMTVKELLESIDKLLQNENTTEDSKIYVSFDGGTSFGEVKSIDTYYDGDIRFVI